MAKRGNAEFFQVLIGQLRQYREIDVVRGEVLGVFGHTELVEPTFDLLLSLHDLPR